MPRKSRSHQFDLPLLELECMKALWSLGQGTVHDVRAQIEPRRALAYTTVMTVMDRLARKGVAVREKQGRSHLYRPAITEQAVKGRAVDKLVDDFFGGSPGKLLDYLQAPANGGLRSDRVPQTADVQGHEPSPGPAASAGQEIDPSLL